MEYWHWAVIITAVLALIAFIFKIGTWKGGVDKHMKSVDSHMKTVADFMAEVRADIKNILGRLGPATVQPGSPMSLTVLGFEVSQDVGAAKWAESQAQLYTSKVKDMQAYDIQAFALEHAEVHKYDEKMEARIKQCAYERGIQRDQVIKVLAIELRDRLLSIRRLEPPE